MGPLSAWGVCAYDRRETADDVLADVQRTHPRLAVDGGTRTVEYRDPAGFLAEQAERDGDPLLNRAPDVELLDPDPEQLAIIEVMAERTQLGRDDVNGLRLSTIELVRNAGDYGLRPICVRVWAAIDRLVVAVTDRGPGLWDPFVGLITRGADGVGFTIRLTQRAGAVT
jgi:signal transduction histidine kinase